MKTAIERDKYSAIVLNSLNKETAKQVENLFEQVRSSSKIDEHGNWSIGIESFGKGYVAINWDLYGVGRDHFTRRLLIVVQIRQSWKRKASHFTSVRKSYFLCGRNEDNTAFAHPVSAQVVRAAIAKEKDVIRACQEWIFSGDYSKMIRQGDIALMPYRYKPEVADGPTIMLLQNSHRLESERIVVDQKERIYALNPSMYHLPETHPDIVGLKGWYRVLIGRRGNFYDFATPTID